MFLDCIRWLAMICLYGGFTAIIVSVLLIADKENPEKTPPLSPAMQCIIHLTIQFFAVYLALWLAISMRQWAQPRRVNEDDYESQHAATTYTPLVILETACYTVMFCPMLCVLFLAARMRALQLTRNKGAPQGWSQDAMRLATLCVFAQLIIVLAQFCPGCGPSHNDDPLETLNGEPVKPVERRPLGICMEFAQFVFLAGMHAGATAVIFGVLTMTEETANGEGSYFWGKDAQTPY